uniref:AT28575p n=1 Tax=Drosophila melanogaster TaxID=7227 RepID=A8E6G7_DROME|nr:AT28575p [Drosophila melanogaster]
MQRISYPRIYFPRYMISRFSDQVIDCSNWAIVLATVTVVLATSHDSNGKLWVL